MRFGLVSRLSLLCMEYRCDEDEKRENIYLPPTYFANFCCEILHLDFLDSWLRVAWPSI